MGLEGYHHKRDFTRTREPKGRVARARQYRFVVQEHHASHLHYDFRLEMGGVLKSWAVPKEPSLNPQHKRLAIMVEDHPVEYLYFVGRIAEGNYGAGEVAIWDTGRYESTTPGDPLQDLAAGHLNVILHGRKLRGVFHLVRMAGKKRQWLLIKEKDEFTDTAEKRGRKVHVEGKNSLLTNPLQLGNTKRHTRSTSGSSETPSMLSIAASPKIISRKRESLTHDDRTRSLLSDESVHEATTPVQPVENPVPRERKIGEKVVSLPQALRAKRLHGNLTLTVERKTVSLTHLDKPYWPDEGYTKGDLIRYYFEIAPILLRYLQDRPFILKRYPNGITGSSFYQHDVPDAPSFVRTFSTPTDSGKVVDYAVCNNLATLLYLTNLGTIVYNPWHSRVQHFDTPDWVVFDLDPQDVNFAAVRTLALGLKDLLDRLGLDSYPKTSGASGMHVYVPVKPIYPYEQIARIAQLIARRAVLEHAKLATLTRSLTKRQRGRIYLDHLQNARGKSVVAPYAVRAQPRASVSAPLTWTEVARPFSPQDFTIATMPQRLAQNGGLFAPVLNHQQRLEDALERLKELGQQTTRTRKRKS